MFRLPLIAQEFTSTYYTSKDGLAIGFHGHITQDYKGQIWTTSQGGLSRFNGKDFEVITYDKTNDRMLNIEEHSPIIESRDSMIWIGTSEGLYMYNPIEDKFDFWGIDSSGHHGPKHPEVTHILEGTNGMLWLGSYAGLHSYDRTINEWNFYEALPNISFQNKKQHSDKAIFVIKKDQFDDNTLWLGGHSMFYKFNIKRTQYLQNWQTPALFDFKTNIQGIEQINENQFYLGYYGGGLNRFDIITNKFTRLVTNSDVKIAGNPFKIVRDFLPIDSTRILCTNYSGSLFTYDSKLNKTTYLDNINVKKKSHQLYKDRDKNIWVSSEEGLTCLSQNLVHVYNKSQTIKDVDLWSASYDPINNCYLVYTTGSNWGFECMNVETSILEFYPIRSTIPYNAIKYDHKIKTFLIINKGELMQIKSKGSNFKPLFKLNKNTYNDLIITESFIYLVDNRTLDKYNRNGDLISSISIPKSIIKNKKNDVHSKFVVLENDKVYYKTNNQIISCDDKQVFKSVIYRPDMIIYGFITIEKVGYIGTNIGLKKCIIDENGKFKLDKKFIDPSGSMNLRFITRVYNHLYMSNGSGVLGYDYIENKRVFQYGEAENLSYLKNLFYNKGKLQSYSANQFYEIELKNNQHKIESISLSDLVISNYKNPNINSDNINLQANQNGISVEWECCYFGHQNQIKYSYKLVGANEKWVSIGNSTRVNFNNLQSGKYELYVKVDAIGDSMTSEILKFEIHPPWWRTWWFILTTIIGIVLLSIYFYRMRIKQIRSENIHQQEIVELELKALRAQMNPHFIFNSLNAIKRLIQRKDNEKAIDYLGDFSMMIRQILSNSDKKLINLEEEIDFCKRYLVMEKLRFQDKFSYHINIDEKVNMETIFVPPLILQPYIENALWHGIMNSGRNGVLNLNIKKLNNTVQIEIDDNGIGREKSLELIASSPLKKKSRGMELSKKRSELSEILYGQKIDIEIIDKYDMDIAIGTTVVIRLID